MPRPKIEDLEKFGPRDWREITTVLNQRLLYMKRQSRDLEERRGTIFRRLSPDEEAGYLAKLRQYQGSCDRVARLLGVIPSVTDLEWETDQWE